MKKLLAISWEMPPLSGPRAVQVTRTLVQLAKHDWHSRVVCFDPQSDRYQQDHDVSIESLSGGAARRLPVRSPEEWLLFRALWRIAPYLKHLPDEKRVWMPSALAEARRALIEEPADAIVSFAQPWTDHLIGLQLHRDTGRPWVAHFSDPWIDSPYQPGGAWTRARVAAMERSVVGEATATVFVNKYTRDRVMAKYPPAWQARAHVIPQGWEPVPHDRPARPAGPLRIVYTGRFYDGIRTPETFLRALATVDRSRSIAGRIDVEFVGSRMDAYQRIAADLGLAASVRFSGRLSPARARDRAAAADVLLTIDAAGDDPSLFLPSKLIDYLPLGKPILALTPIEGASADLVRALGYFPIEPRDLDAITAALTAMLDAHHTGTLAAAPGHDGVARQYDIAETTRDFAAVLDRAVGQS